MEIDRYLQPNSSSELVGIVNNLVQILGAEDKQADYYRELLEKPVNQAFAAGLLDTLSQREDLDWDIYALRSTYLLTFPGSKGTGVAVGQTVFYSHNYERHSQSAKEIWQAAFSQAGYSCSNQHDRGFRVDGLLRKDVYGLLETYNLVVFNKVPPLIQR